MLEFHVTASENVAYFILLLIAAAGSCRKKIRKVLQKWISDAK